MNKRPSTYFFDFARRRLAFFIGLCLIALLSAPPALSFNRFFENPELGHHNLAAGSDLLEDPDNDLTIKQVSSPAWAGKFKKNKGGEIDLGHSRSTWWLRFKLKSNALADSGPNPTQSGAWFLEVGKPGLGELDLYIPTKRGWLIKKTGAERPVDSKEVLHRSYVFELPAGFLEDAYFYLRVRSSISLNFSLLAWQPSQYAAWTVADFYGFGVIYGVLLSMILYNFFIFLTLRDKAYLFYVLHTTSVFIQLQLVYGHLTTFFSLPPGWLVKAIWVNAGITWMAAAAFSRSFLETKTNIPRFDKVLLGFIWFAPTLCLLGLLGFSWWANMLNSLLMLTAPLICLWAAILCLRQDFGAAKYFILAWAILLVGLVLYSMGGVWIPRTFVTRYTLAIGAAAEAVLLSLALAARIRAWREEKETLKRRERYLKHLSITDGLTGLYNRRYFMDTLSHQIGHYQQEPEPLSLLIMDVDDFKAFNDRYGHDQGDEVLVVLALLIKECARASDSACRYGGEEFAVILPDADLDNALAVAERIRTSFAEISFSPQAGSSVKCSVSLGVAQLRPEERYSELIRRADQALYRAKQAGKNQTKADRLMAA